MANVPDYPVTQDYGYDPGYPLNNSYHKGIDYGCPVGTPVVVNGVQIGLTGATGAVTGPHCHVGRWVGGQATNPGRGGFTFSSAVVYDTGYDAVNGNFVRVTADGALWCYLHLSQITTNKGTVLKQQGDTIMNPDEEANAYRIVLNRNPEPGAVLGKRTGYQFITGAQAELNAQRTSVQQTIQNLQTALQNEQNKPPKEVVKEVEKVVTEYVDKPVYVDRPVEVVKDAPLTWQKVIDFVKEQISKLTKKG
jgi:hypothetical protein